MAVLIGAIPMRADVATEGEVDVRVELMNAQDFPKFKFFIKYQEYYYDMGYQPGDVTPVYFEPGKPISTGERGDASLLYAEDENGHEYASEEPIGGVATDFGRDVSYLLDQIKVTSIKGDLIKFKVVSRHKVDSDGKLIGVKKGEFSAEDPENRNWMLIILPAVCLLGLVLFFIFRKRSHA